MSSSDLSAVMYSLERNRISVIPKDRAIWLYAINEKREFYLVA